MPILTVSRCIGLAAAFCAAGALAQPVYKCEVAGKATYQSEPCSAGKSSAVTIIGGPTDADAAAARQRAQQERRTADVMTAPPPPPRNNGYTPQVRRGQGDCNGLAAQREGAYSRRNAALNGARRGVGGVTAGSKEDLAIGGMNTHIDSLESQMRARGCALN
jgi:hypothetical protein